MAPSIHKRRALPRLRYQLGVLFASSVTYIEAVLGEHFTYAEAIGILAATLLLVGALVIALGPEAKAVAFAKADPG